VPVPPTDAERNGRVGRVRCRSLSAPAVAAQVGPDGRCGGVGRGPRDDDGVAAGAARQHGPRGGSARRPPLAGPQSVGEPKAGAAQAAPPGYARGELAQAPGRRLPAGLDEEVQGRRQSGEHTTAQIDDFALNTERMFQGVPTSLG